MSLRVLHLSTYAGGGGAGRAAASLNLALQNAGVDSRLVSAHGARFKAARAADRALWRLQRSPTKTWRSPARFGSLTAAEINVSSADIVNLHWITDGFISIEEIGKITKPLVMSMYDMWPFCGSEHYGVDQADARWITGYTRQNRPSEELGLDIDRSAWERKKRSWRNFQLVPASTWLASNVRQSGLMSDWPVTQIPHAVDASTFNPSDKIAARSQLGIDTHAPTIAFFSSAGIGDYRKGFDLLAEAMGAVRSEFPNVQVLLVGPKPDPSEIPVSFKVLALGSVTGDHALAAAYSAADVLAVPSREDNMPLTAMEAQMCGRPVVGFSLGGLPDIVENGTTGYLASPFDSKELAIGLINSINDSITEGRLGHSARYRAAAIWGQKPVASAYLQLYDRLRMR